MTPWFFRNCIGYQFSCWDLASILILLTSIIFFYISLYLLCHFWLPIVSYIMMEVYYFFSQFSLQDVYSFFFYNQPFFNYLFLISYHFYPCFLQFFHCFYYLFVLPLYLFDLVPQIICLHQCFYSFYSSQLDQHRVLVVVFYSLLLIWSPA